jgi:DNA polymerase-3 subunit gamma/tau
MSKTEGIEITEDAARVIARVSRGGMRDAISLLELCAGANTKIDERVVFETVGSGNRESAYGVIKAISSQDYSAIYSIIADIVMKSGDISVFWQELIDSYRDIMVVKNSDKAKSYLDLTDAEYATLSEIASTFTMSRLSYHVSLLENAMADMQRAFNSKRSIAEIALTRMCNPKLDGSTEALILRIEELEREISMIKLGVVTPTKENEPSGGSKTSEVKASPSVKPSSEASASTANEEARVAYSGWGRVLSRIGEVKVPLAGGLASATVERAGNKFFVKARSFFVRKITSNQDDFAILKGVIAEVEGISKDSVSLELVSLDERTSSDHGSELDTIFG